MAKRITDRVTWVGKIDWELKTFHGEELSTHKGSSYNSYLIRDKKNALIDTVWLPYDKEFVSRLKEEIDLKEIDYIIINHGEVDHSGSLPELMKQIPDTPIYCTANAVKSLKGQYHQDWNFKIVKTGDTLNLGETELTFIEAPMLHWPDTMFCYLSKENILFSNDGFGQHFATEMLFNDRVDQEEVYYEALKYYTNILAPFSKMVTAKINEIMKMNIPINMICTSHGVIWKENPMQIVEKYLQWANNYQENQITILYDTMWNATRQMAEAIARGIQQVNKDITIKLYHIGKEDKNDVLTEVFKSKAILVGCPTINNGYSYATAGMLEMLKGLKLKNKKAAAFGSFGWSGEAVKLITEHLRQAGFEIIEEGLRITWKPDEEGEKQAILFGEAIGEILK